MRKALWGAIALVIIIGAIIIIALPRKETIIIAAFGNYEQGEGSFQDLGYKGMLLAVNELNALETKRNFELVKIDTSIYTEEPAIISRLEELRVDIIIGPFFSSTLETYGTFLLNCGYTVFVPSATYDNVTGGDDHLFRLMTSTSNQGHQTAEALDRLDYQNVYFIYDTVNQSYTKELTDYITDDPSFSDKSFVTHELIDYAFDFTTEITSNFDVIYLCASAEKAANTINNIRSLGIDLPIILSSWSDNGVLLEDLDSGLEHIYIYSNAKIVNPVNATTFSNIFFTTYQYQSSVSSLYSYEVVYMINALTGEEKYDQDTFKERLTALTSYNGKFNRYYNLGNGDFYTYMGFKEVRNGNFIDIQENDLH